MRSSDKLKGTKSDLHNEIVVWLFTQVTDELDPLDLYKKNKETIERTLRVKYRRSEEYKNQGEDKSFVLPEYDYSITASIESPIYNDRGKTSGYADLVAIISFSTKDTFNFRNYGDFDNEPIEDHVKVLFEVKSKFNLGECVRQIKYYRDIAYFSESYVVSPPHDHSVLLENENIGFIEYSSPGTYD